MPPVTSDRRDRNPRYHPWRDLRDNWPEIRVIIEPMPGRLLGELRYPVIALRAGTSAAQRRCTLAHEIVHLERGLRDCGPWANREERYVHDEVARRLVPIGDLARAIRGTGGTHDLAAVAAALDVDGDTLRVRLNLVTAGERALIVEGACDIWSVA
ncbi:MAG: hypothetical protein QOG80_2790 [Pseudonocardiales bacterium]|jgi:hypothetical protein|nr:hypothetical protein [Pseudonocardiales bacterium]